MPKKFQTENTKSAQARARKAEAKATEKARLEKEKEDEAWRDDDKQVARKQQRKADKEKKRQEEVARKNENKKLLAEEEDNIKPSKTAKPEKLTRAQVIANRQALEKAEAEARKQKAETHLDKKLDENVNIAAAKARAEGIEEARNVEDAISVLSVDGDAPVDRHPEKRMKAAYLAYEEVNLPRLKAENPNMRLSQLKQMLRKDWMKSPENPLNLR